MPATASDRRRSGYRIGAREVPVPWLAGAAVAVLGLLLFAGDAPLRPALATLALGALAALTVTGLHGAAVRWRARRRAERAHAAVMREGIARLRDAHAPSGAASLSDSHAPAGAAPLSDAHAPDPAAASEPEATDLLAALAALSGADVAATPCSLAAAARAATATARPAAEARNVRLLVSVDQDTPVRVAGLEPALRCLLRCAATGAPPGSTVTAAVRRGRIELRDAAPPADSFAVELVRAIAHRGGGDLLVLADGSGTLTVLELPGAA
jgi:hypothetical protein